MTDIASGSGHVLEKDGDAAAYGAIIFTGEPVYEQINGSWRDNGPYVTLHRLAVSENFQGRGLAKSFFANAEAQARERGVFGFRIDTSAENQAMLGLLATLGFSYRGQVDYGVDDALLAFEKQITI